MAVSNKRQQRLESEWSLLQQVNADSDHVQVEAIEILPGRAPEKYRVTFVCRGIAGIDPSRNPVFGTEHRVRMECHAGFPADVPFLHWETPIWHPNIEHAGQKRVCVNKTEWLGGLALADLCQQMFEMVQYKNYHADPGNPPYPLDMEAANWVREVGEPKGIVDKKRGIFVDNRPFYRPDAPERPRRILIKPQEDRASQGPRIRFGHSPRPEPSGERPNVDASNGSSTCPNCNSRIAPGSSFCTACGQGVSAGTRRIRIGS
jgi:ubiquitin-protein ligase